MLANGREYDIYPLSITVVPLTKGGGVIVIVIVIVISMQYSITIIGTFPGHTELYSHVFLYAGMSIEGLAACMLIEGATAPGGTELQIPRFVFCVLR